MKIEHYDLIPTDQQVTRESKGKSRVGLITGAALTAFALATCMPSHGRLEVLPQQKTEDVKPPLGFPHETIISSVESFSTGNQGDASIPRAELTDPVGEPIIQSSDVVTSSEGLRYPGDVDGILNPPGMDDVLIGTEEAWKPVGEDGQVKDNYIGFK